MDRLKKIKYTNLKRIIKTRQNVARETSPMRHFLIIFISLIFIICINIHSNAAYTLNGIENFPDSYKPYLEVLKNKHPDWNFTALYTEPVSYTHLHNTILLYYFFFYYKI